MEIREVLRRHNVPNNYRRGANEYVQQYEDDDDEEDAPPPAPTPTPQDPQEWDEDEYDDDVYEPKTTRYVPKTDAKVAAVYSQIFGRY